MYDRRFLLFLVTDQVRLSHAHIPEDNIITDIFKSCGVRLQA